MISAAWVLNFRGFMISDKIWLIVLILMILGSTIYDYFQSKKDK